MNKKLTERLKRHTADSLLLWVKFHNLHWNLHGFQFKAVHELTEGYYDELAEDYDLFAERLVQLGEKPPVTLAASLKAAGLSELERDSFTVQEVLSAVRQDFLGLLDEYRESRDLAAEAGDSTTEDIFVGIVARLEKEIWMLEAALQA